MAERKQNTMEINFRKRHIFLLFAIIAALYLMIPAWQEMHKISHAKKLSDCEGQYVPGEFVKVDFDRVLYMEYEEVYGGTQKRYAVYGIPEGNAYYVNALPQEYILVEVIDPKIIKSVETEQLRKQSILGRIENCEFDVHEFLDEIPYQIKAEKTILVRQVLDPGKYPARMKAAGVIFLISVILCVPGTFRRKITTTP